MTDMKFIREFTLKQHSRLSLLSLLFTIVFVLSSCDKKATALDGTHWKMKDWTLEIPKPQNSEITLYFDATTISGTIGINTFNASYNLATKESLEINNIQITHDEDINISPQHINKIIDSFRDSTFFQIEKDEMIFYSKEGLEIFIFHADK